MSPESEIAPRVAALIEQALAVEVPAHDADLIDSGALDSLGLVSLIGEIEREFGFELPLDEFDIDDFRSVDRMAALVAANKGDEAAS
jgi:D-alanine--poly(phosphoribitol) ligase subunit 2